MTWPTLLTPLIVALLTLAGLVAALIADDSWNWLAALLLGPSVLVAIRTMLISLHRLKGSV